MTIVARLKVRAGQEAAFEAAAREMVAYVKASEPGTQTYVLHRSAANPTEYLFYEVYADQAALAAHSGSAALARFFAAVQGLLDGAPEIGLYEALAAKP